MRESMHITINQLATPNAGNLCALLTKQFDNLLTEFIGPRDFKSGLAAIVVFPTIIDPRRGHIPDKVSHRRGENAVFTGVNIPHDQFMQSDATGRVDLFAAAVRASLEQMKEKHLPAEDRAWLFEQVEAVRVELRRRLGATVDDALITLASAAPDEVEEEARTQIVLQWLADLAVGGLGLGDIAAMEDMLEAESEGLFEVDGHDLGSGTINIFLFAADAGAATARLIALAVAGRLQPGVRIGVQGLEAVYPPGVDRLEPL
jgi:hypothetical protein